LREVLVKGEDVTTGKAIGKGAFGVVNLGTYKDTPVAIKQLQIFDEESIGRFRFECFLMKNLRHPNIVKLIGVCWEDIMLCCLLEYVDNGSFEDWLRKDLTKPPSKKMT